MPKEGFRYEALRRGVDRYIYQLMQKSGATSEAGQPAAPRGRGRPREFDRDAALEQAMLLFWRKGFGATSISDLTKALGIGSPSLYAAFGSKEALYVEALRHYRTTYDARVSDKLQSEVPAREAVAYYLMEAAAVLTGDVDRPPGCMVTLGSVCSEDHLDLHELMRSERQANLDRLKERLRKAVTEGELPASVDVHVLARFVQTVVSGISILARDGASRADLEAVSRMAMEGWDTQSATRWRTWVEAPGISPPNEPARGGRPPGTPKETP